MVEKIKTSVLKSLTHPGEDTAKPLFHKKKVYTHTLKSKKESFKLKKKPTAPKDHLEIKFFKFDFKK